MGVICCSRIREGLPHAQAWFFIGSRAGVVLIGRRVWSGLISVGFPPRKRGANLDCEICLTFQELQIRCGAYLWAITSASLVLAAAPASPDESTSRVTVRLSSLLPFFKFVPLVCCIQSFVDQHFHVLCSIFFLSPWFVYSFFHFVPSFPPVACMTAPSTTMVSFFLFHHDGESLFIPPWWWVPLPSPAHSGDVPSIPLIFSAAILIHSWGSTPLCSQTSHA